MASIRELFDEPEPELIPLDLTKQRKCRLKRKEDPILDLLEEPGNGAWRYPLLYEITWEGPVKWVTGYRESLGYYQQRGEEEASRIETDPKEQWLNNFLRRGYIFGHSADEGLIKVPTTKKITSKNFRGPRYPIRILSDYGGSRKLASWIDSRVIVRSVSLKPSLVSSSLLQDLACYFAYLPPGTHLDGYYLKDDRYYIVRVLGTPMDLQARLHQISQVHPSARILVATHQWLEEPSDQDLSNHLILDSTETLILPR